RRRSGGREPAAEEGGAGDSDQSRASDGPHEVASIERAVAIRTSLPMLSIHRTLLLLRVSGKRKPNRPAPSRNGGSLAGMTLTAKSRTKHARCYHRRSRGESKAATAQ